MGEMVKRIARAMESRSGSFTFEELAAIAITALREPTDGMVEQMQVEVNLCADSGEFEYLSRDEVVDIWERGLLEALK